MKKIQLLTCILMLLLFSTAAIANPISTDFWKGIQTPDSMHVQLGFYSLGPEPMKDLNVKIEGEDPLVLAEENTIPYNGGSGASPYRVEQFCACDLAVGKTIFTTSYSIEAKAYEETLSVTVVDPPPVLSDIEQTDENPSGLDCIEWCKNPTDIDGKSISDSNNDSGSRSDDGEGGCNQSSQPVAFVLIVALLFLRRRIVF